MTSNNLSKKTNRSAALAASLDELTAEGANFTNLLDELSADIRALEKNISALKVHIPFHFLIKEDKESPAQAPTAAQKAIYPLPLGYRTRARWHLSWDIDEESGNYRLFAIITETGIVYFNVDDDRIHSEELKPKCLFKRPLISATAQTRLLYAEHLVPFAQAFKEYLKIYGASLSARAGSDHAEF